jgi:predicted GTPase
MEMVKEDLQKILVQMSQDLNKFHSTKVKCGIIGRSGTGKSSLINAIVGEYIAEVGEIETTTEVKLVEYKGLIFYDLPGCSTTSFPKEDYIDNFEIKNFDCVIIVTSERFYEDDLYLIEELSKINMPVFALRTKIDFSVDRAKRRGVSEEDALLQIRTNLTENMSGYPVKGIYLTSADFPREYDLSILIDEIIASLGKLKRERFIADVNIISEKLLSEKRKIAEKLVSKYSALAAANGLNPIPGVDIGVDLGLLIKMGYDIKNIYGLNEKQQEFDADILDQNTKKYIGGKILQFTVKYLGKEALLVLLKRAGTSMATKEFAKWVPFVGQAIAAGIGYKICSSIGADMINDAEKIAEEIFDVIVV